MQGAHDRKELIEQALNAVRNGDFDQVKRQLELLGFIFKQGKNPDHWIYWHPRLREDPLFRYPCNLYRPHGSRREKGRISHHDQSKARQRIEALRAQLASSTEETGGDE